MVWPLASSAEALSTSPTASDGQADLLVLQFGVGIVGALHVGAQEAGKFDDLAAGGELGILACR